MAEKWVVVDTNVAVVANGRSDQASTKCIGICIKRLKNITNGYEKLVLDDKWQIIKEYLQNLRSSGQPGVGDAFLKWVLNNHQNNQRCELTNISPLGLDEFPKKPDLAQFDPSDKKFVAVSLSHHARPPILQAVDSKWWLFRDALNHNGIMVEFICEEDIKRLSE